MSNPIPETTLSKTVLVTGATGYLGGRLAGVLLKEGYSIRCLARSPQKLQVGPGHLILVSRSCRATCRIGSRLRRPCVGAGRLTTWSTP